MFIDPKFARRLTPKPRHGPRSPAQLVSWWANRFQRNTQAQTTGIWHSNDGRKPE